MSFCLHKFTISLLEIFCIAILYSFYLKMFYSKWEFKKAPVQYSSGGATSLRIASMISSTLFFREKIHSVANNLMPLSSVPSSVSQRLLCSLPSISTAAAFIQILPACISLFTKDKPRFINVNLIFYFIALLVSAIDSNSNCIPKCLGGIS